MNIVIIGNGVAGIEAARTVRRAQPAWSITLVSEESDHFISRTALMWVVSGQLSHRCIEPHERDLYRREGFIEIGRRPRYYQPDDVDAIIMQLDLVGWDAARREASGIEPAAAASGGVCT